VAQRLLLAGSHAPTEDKQDDANNRNARDD
jgi:hypothetical protein